MGLGSNAFSIFKDYRNSVMAFWYHTEEEHIFTLNSV